MATPSSSSSSKPSIYSLDLYPSPSTSSSTSIPDPPLYVDPTPQSSLTSRKAPGNLKRKDADPSSGPAVKGRLEPEELHALRQSKAWEVATGPAKQIPMQGFMLWMSGSGVQIFSMMTVYMLIKNAITGALNVSKTFVPFEPPSEPVAPGASPAPKPYDLTMQKLAFVACQGSLLALGLWKINSMGLLPTKTSDWFMFEDRPAWAERPDWFGQGVIF